MPVSVVLDIDGKQHSAVEGETLKVDQFNAPVGEKVMLDRVMAAVDGGNSRYGAPYIEGARVEAKVLKHGRDKKVLVFKYKPKKRRRVLRGHRRNYSLLRVESITIP